MPQLLDWLTVGEKETSMRSVLLLGLTALAATAFAGEPAAVFDGLFPEGRLTLALASLAEGQKLAPDEDFKISDLGHDANSSHHSVWIRDREVPHRHDRHDLFVVILKGYGEMRLGEDTRSVGLGSILYVPRGTPHAFRNLSPEPALAYAVYAPAFDGKDRVPLD